MAAASLVRVFCARVACKPLGSCVCVCVSQKESAQISDMQREFAADEQIVCAKVA